MSTLDKIQRALCAADGYVSGEELAAICGVTRAAVWKHVRALQAAGYGISSAPGKGYMLSSSPDALSAAAIAARGSPFPCAVVREAVSTNELARRMAENGAPHGSAVLTERQTGGKGRLGREWRGLERSIAMSVVLRPDIRQEEAPKLSVVAALAAAGAIAAVSGLPAGIKWPNDILLGVRKVCGISLRMSAEPDAMHYVVAGFGINVNAYVPQELSAIATSIIAESGRETDRNALCAALLRELDGLLREWRDEGFSNIIARYRAISDTLGKRVRITGRDQALEGVVEGFDEDGLLLLNTGSELLKIISGDVSLRSV